MSENVVLLNPNRACGLCTHSFVEHMANRAGGSRSCEVRTGALGASCRCPGFTEVLRLDQWLDRLQRESLCQVVELKPMEVGAFVRVVKKALEASLKFPVECSMINGKSYCQRLEEIEARLVDEVSHKAHTIKTLSEELKQTAKELAESKERAALLQALVDSHESGKGMPF